MKEPAVVHTEVLEEKMGQIQLKSRPLVCQTFCVTIFLCV